MMIIIGAYIGVEVGFHSVEAGHVAVPALGRMSGINNGGSDDSASLRLTQSSSNTPSISHGKRLSVCSRV